MPPATGVASGLWEIAANDPALALIAGRDRICRRVGRRRPTGPHAFASRRAGRVKLELDENLPASAAPRLAALGHDVHTVLDESPGRQAGRRRGAAHS
jgi:hypothetical protein